MKQDDKIQQKFNGTFTFLSRFVVQRTIHWLRLGLVWDRHLFAKKECNQSRVRPMYHHQHLRNGFWLNNESFLAVPIQDKEILKEKCPKPYCMRNGVITKQKKKKYLIQWNAKFIVETSLSRFPNAHRINFIPFALDIIQRMTTACVCITIRKCNLWKKKKIIDIIKWFWFLIMKNKVTLCDDRFWINMSPFELNKNTLNARCNLMWPFWSTRWQSRLDDCPIARSNSSTRIQFSANAVSCKCFASNWLAATFVVAHRIFNVFVFKYCIEFRRKLLPNIWLNELVR